MASAGVLVAAATLLVVLLATTTNAHIARRGVAGLPALAFRRLVVYLLQKVLEDVLHIVRCHSTSLRKEQPVLPSKLGSVVVEDLACRGVLLGEVDFVPDEHDDNVRLSVLTQLLHPLYTVLEGGLLGHIVHKQGSNRTSVVELVIARYRSCPAVSQICAFTVPPTASGTMRVANSTPMVAVGAFGRVPLM
eukprot:CAMPEP_0179077120 /NCGR_PEP_ID=MMETSP0796-20121207/34451_1 /TAXON_ID=73915 /ORGANISM="Pyrodinium bahamense, Strain pbaha01" /LENGTH=190 /DNA_ID=CAMNT_0020774391 /DNA_START=225 /DNA_END=798 /DNA_ORIENTATION=-